MSPSLNLLIHIPTDEVQIKSDTGNQTLQPAGLLINNLPTYHHHHHVGVLISLCLFLFLIFSTTKIYVIFLGWVKEVRTPKS
jgi:hypothetical protein